MKIPLTLLFILFASICTCLAASNIISSTYAEGLATFAKDGLFGYVDTNGTVVISNKYYVAMPFSEGLGAVKTSSKLWGYVDKTGTLVISDRFDIATPFTNGVAVVGLGTKWNRIARKLWDAPGKVKYLRIDHRGNILGVATPKQ